MLPPCPAPTIAAGLACCPTVGSPWFAALGGLILGLAVAALVVILACRR
jgi:hypothetical protein